MREQKENESRPEYLLLVAAEYIRSNGLQGHPVTFDGCKTEDCYSLLDSIENEVAFNQAQEN